MVGKGLYSSIDVANEREVCLSVWAKSRCDFSGLSAASGFSATTTTRPEIGAGRLLPPPPPAPPLLSLAWPWVLCQNGMQDLVRLSYLAVVCTRVFFIDSFTPCFFFSFLLVFSIFNIFFS